MGAPASRVATGGGSGDGRARSFLRAALAPLAILGILAAPATAAGDPVASCLSIDRVTAFAPRGQIYVQVRASCSEDRFLREDPILVYLEVLVGDLPPAGQDLRVYSEQPQRRETIVFSDLALESGDHVLVRLVRFGEILGLQTVQVP